ncbi:MAG: methionine aminotransferase [Candidatus Aminicenantes bacterium]|nr:methionine aminotransferase [Candidatus Aminicenantes bacterium]
MILRSKLPEVGVTIFAVMSKLANDYHAINLSQGFPDFNTSLELVELVNKYMRSGHNQYAPMQGVPALRKSIGEKVRKTYTAVYDPESEITVTSGATEALFSAITAVVHPGDEVLVFEPAYDVYVPTILLCGGIPVFTQLTHPEYRYDWKDVKKKLSKKTRALILNSPHNPCGTVLSHYDIEELISIVQDTSILIISDEVYEHIIFDGRIHESLCRYPELKKRSFIISSFGKTYHTTGWKTGYCLAPQDMSREFQRVHQFVTYAVNTPVQYAYAEILEKEQTYLGLSDFYQKKRDLFINVIQDSRFKAIPCSGTYFQILDYSAITDENDLNFANRLVREFGIAAIPPSVFYHKNGDHRVLRFCFAKKDDTLQEAGRIICRI